MSVIQGGPSGRRAPVLPGRRLAFPDFGSFLWTCTRYAVLVCLSISLLMLPPVQRHVVAPVLVSFARIETRCDRSHIGTSSELWTNVTVSPLP